MPPKRNVCSPKGEIGIRLNGPASIAVKDRKIMARLIVAMIIEKTGSPFRGRLIIKSIIIPKKTAKMSDPINAKRNIHPFNPPVYATNRFKK